VFVVGRGFRARGGREGEGERDDPCVGVVPRWWAGAGESAGFGALWRHSKCEPCWRAVLVVAAAAGAAAAAACMHEGCSIVGHLHV